jgi:hypothetical protein
VFERTCGHINDKIHVYCYRNKTGKQFVDFLIRVDKRYDKSIQNIFLVLDNLSAYKSKLAKKEISNKRCPRIKFVFLPVRSPKLELIEVRWSWLQKPGNQQFLFYRRVRNRASS